MINKFCFFRALHEICIFCTFCCLLLSKTFCEENYEIMSGIVMHRHGMRAALRKDENLVENDTRKPDVTVFGQIQLDHLGTVLRSMYTKTLLHEQYLGLDGKDEPNVYFQSSWLDRAVRSGLALMNSLFPADKDYVENTRFGKVKYSHQNIPMRMLSPARDPYLRGWTYCPAFISNLKRFYQSDEFLMKDQETADDRKRLLQKLGIEASTNFANFFNDFDVLELSQVELNSGYQGQTISDEEYKHALNIVGWLEFKRYDRGLQQNIVGGLMARRIWGSVRYHSRNIPYDLPPGKYHSIEDEKQYAFRDIGYKRKLQVYSVHYPTVMSVLSAIGVPFKPFTKYTIPNFGSAIAIELVRQKSTEYFYVRVLYIEAWKGVGGKKKINDPGNMFHRLKFASTIWYGTQCYENDICSVDEFLSILEPILATYSVDQWCEDCTSVPNTKQESRVNELCVKYLSDEGPRQTAVALLLMGCLSSLIGFVVFAMDRRWTESMRMCSTSSPGKSRAKASS